MKICFRCKKAKSFSQFGPKVGRAGEDSEYCKLCTIQVAALVREAKNKKKKSKPQPQSVDVNTKIIKKLPDAIPTQKMRNKTGDPPKRGKRSEAYKAAVRRNRRYTPAQKRKFAAQYRERNPARVAEAQARRRTIIKRGQELPLRALRQRDKTCYLCESPIDYRLLYPHPYSRSLDHKIPIITGGTHTIENVAYTHLRCNLSKGKRNL